MRVMLTMDDDVLETARDIARREGTTVGAVVSRFARFGLGLERRRSDFPTFPDDKGAPPITLEMVNRHRDS